MTFEVTVDHRYPAVIKHTVNGMVMNFQVVHVNVNGRGIPYQFHPDSAPYSRLLYTYGEVDISEVDANIYLRGNYNHILGRDANHTLSSTATIKTHFSINQLLKSHDNNQWYRCNADTIFGSIAFEVKGVTYFVKIIRAAASAHLNHLENILGLETGTAMTNIELRDRIVQVK